MPTRQDIQNSARKLIGAPWHHQGRNPISGIDCIGNIIFTGLDSGAFTKEQIDKADSVDYARQPDGYKLMEQRLAENLISIPIAEAREGDILTFRMAGEKLTSHVAIIVKGEREYNIIHSLEKAQTIEQSLRVWKSRITSAFRFKGVTD